MTQAFASNYPKQAAVHVNGLVTVLGVRVSQRAMVSDLGLA